MILHKNMESMRQVDVMIIKYLFVQLMKKVNNEHFQRYLSRHAGGGRKSITFILMALLVLIIVSV